MFHDSVRRGDAKKILEIIKGNPDVVNSIDHNGDTGLMIACQTGTLSIATILASHGAYLNILARDGSTAFMQAIEFGHHSLAKMLLTRDGIILDTHNLTENKNCLHLACEKNFVSLAEAIIATNVVNPNVQTSTGLTALMIVAGTGETAIAKSLIISLKADVNLKNSDGSTALIFAATAGHYDIVRLLCENDAHINAQELVEGNTALIGAAKNNHFEIVRELLHLRALYDKQDNSGCTALIVSAINGNVKMVQELIAVKADLNATNSLNETALMKSCEMEHRKVVEVLLKKGAQMEIGNQDGWTALLIAVAKGHAEITKMLLKKGAQMDVFSSDYWTPLLIACEQSPDIVELLVKNGCSLNAPEGGPAESLSSPLIKAVSFNQRKSVDILLNAGAPTNIQDSTGRTAFFVACEMGFLAMATSLVKHNADVTIAESQGVTALLTVCRSGRLDVVKFILGIKGFGGIDFATEEQNLETALMAACSNGFLDIVSDLLKAGAQLNLESKDGKTALMFAVINDFIDVVTLLCEFRCDVNYRNQIDGHTAITYAAETNNIPILTYLVNVRHGDSDCSGCEVTPMSTAVKGRYLDVIVTLESYGCNLFGVCGAKVTPLMLACRYRFDDIAEYLVEKAVVNNSPGVAKSLINAQANNGRTALMDACNFPAPAVIDPNDEDEVLAANAVQIRLINLLLKQGADWNVTDINGSTIFHHAAGDGLIDLLPFLLIHPNNMTNAVKRDIDLKNKQGYTPLMCAVENNRADVVKLLLSHRANADVFSKRLGLSSITIAANNGYDKIIRLLCSAHPCINPITGGVEEEMLSKPCNININSRAKNSPILLAAEKGHVEAARALCEMKCDLNMCDGTSRSALIIAASLGYFEICKILVEHGATLNLQDKDGYTALFKSISGKHYEVGTYLISHGADASLRALSSIPSRTTVATSSTEPNRFSHMTILEYVFHHHMLDETLCHLCGNGLPIQHGSQLRFVIDILIDQLPKCASANGVLSICFNGILTGLHNRHEIARSSGVIDEGEDADLDLVSDLVKLSAALKLAYRKHPLEKRVLKSKLFEVTNMISQCMMSDSMTFMSNANAVFSRDLVCSGSSTPNLGFTAASLVVATRTAMFSRVSHGIVASAGASTTTPVSFLHSNGFRPGAYVCKSFRATMARSLLEGSMALCMKYRLTEFVCSVPVIRHINSIASSTLMPPMPNLTIKEMVGNVIPLPFFQPGEYIGKSTRKCSGGLSKFKASLKYPRYCPTIWIFLEGVSRLMFFLTVLSALNTELSLYSMNYPPLSPNPGDLVPSTPPTSMPSPAPSSMPTSTPSWPTRYPTSTPSQQPSVAPTSTPSSLPSHQPTTSPSTNETFSHAPSTSPTFGNTDPSTQPTSQPSPAPVDTLSFLESVVVAFQDYFDSGQAGAGIMVVAVLFYEFGLFESCQHSTLFSYLTHSSFWNLHYYAGILCVLGFVVFQWRGRKYHEWSLMMLAISILFIALSLFKYPSLSKPVGVTAYITMNMCYQLWSLMVLYLMVAFSFGSTLFVLLLSHSADEADSIFNISSFASVQDTFFSMFNSAAGNHNFSYLTASSTIPSVNKVAAAIIFMLYIIISSVILLHMVLTRMVLHYKAVEERSVAQWALYHCRTIQQALSLYSGSPFCMLPPPLNLLAGLLYVPHYAFVSFQRQALATLSHYDAGKAGTDTGEASTAHPPVPTAAPSTVFEIISLADSVSDVILFVFVGMLPLSILTSMSLVLESFVDLSKSSTVPFANQGKWHMLRTIFVLWIPTIGLLIFYPFLWIFCLVYHLFSFRWMKVVIEPYWRCSSRFNHVRSFRSDEDEQVDDEGDDDRESSTEVKLSPVLERYVLVFPDEDVDGKSTEPAWGTEQWFGQYMALGAEMSKSDVRTKLYSVEDRERIFGAALPKIYKNVKFLFSNIMDQLAIISKRRDRGAMSAEEIEEERKELQDIRDLQTKMSSMRESLIFSSEAPNDRRDNATPAYEGAPLVSDKPGAFLAPDTEMEVADPEPSPSGGLSGGDDFFGRRASVKASSSADKGKEKADKKKANGSGTETKSFYGMLTGGASFFGGNATQSSMVPTSKHAKDKDGGGKGEGLQRSGTRRDGDRSSRPKPSRSQSMARK